MANNYISDAMDSQSPATSLSRHNSVMKYFKAHMGDGPDASSINADELKLLSKAYHHLADAKRDCIRRLKAFLDTIEDDDEGKCATVVNTVRSVFDSILADARDDLIAICDGVIDTVHRIFLQDAVDTPEIVLLYSMKGDFYKYKWEANNDDATSGKEATSAYYEAMNVSQWNMDATAPCLLLATANYAEHLHDTGDIHLAVAVLKSAIECAQQHLHYTGGTDGADGDGSLLIDLNARLERYQAIADRMPVRLFDLIDGPESDDDSTELVEREPSWDDDSSEFFERETSWDDDSSEFFECEAPSGDEPSRTRD